MTSATKLRLAQLRQIVGPALTRADVRIALRAAMAYERAAAVITEADKTDPMGEEYARESRAIAAELAAQSAAWLSEKQRKDKI